MAKGEKFRVDENGEFRPILTDDGREIPDSTPMAPPIGFKRQPPLHERIRAMVQHEYARAREQGEFETPEEADDFRIPGDDDGGDDPREGRFALMPGHEWEDNYEPPKDFKEMRDRLIGAGWTPPSEANQARTPLEGGATDGPTASEAPAPARKERAADKPVPRPESNN